jgi:hypothetical protein
MVMAALPKQVQWQQQQELQMQRSSAKCTAATQQR